MAKWRKKPVVIEAFCLGVDPMPDWFTEAMISQVVTTHNMLGNQQGGPDMAFIETLEGRMQANYGDWIIKGIRNEIYPCRPDIFLATYEPVA